MLYSQAEVTGSGRPVPVILLFAKITPSQSIREQE